MKEIKESKEDWNKWLETIKATNAEELVENKPIDRGELNLQRFFNDMEMIGTQVNSGKIKKPNFFYGDISVTNYLLWLILAELMMKNDKSGVE